MTGTTKKTDEAKPEPKGDDRVAKLEKEVAALKDLMRANGWTI